MSRFANAKAERLVDFGACLCDGTPHESDWAKVRAQLSTMEIAGFANATQDNVAEIAAQFVMEWNLLGEDGKPEPITAESITALMPPTLTPLVDGINKSVAESSALPNGFGAPSASSSRASASRTRTTRTRH